MGDALAAAAAVVVSWDSSVDVRTSQKLLELATRSQLRREAGFRGWTCRAADNTACSSAQQLSFEAQNLNAGARDTPAAPPTARPAARRSDGPAPPPAAHPPAAPRSAPPVRAAASPRRRAPLAPVHDHLHISGLTNAQPRICQISWCPRWRCLQMHSVSSCAPRLRSSRGSRNGCQYLVQGVLRPPCLLLRLLQLLPQGAHLATGRGPASGLVHHWQVPKILSGYSINRPTADRSARLPAGYVEPGALEMVATLAGMP